MNASVCVNNQVSRRKQNRSELDRRSRARNAVANRTMPAPHNFARNNGQTFTAQQSFTHAAQQTFLYAAPSQLFNHHQGPLHQHNQTIAVPRMEQAHHIVTTNPPLLPQLQGHHVPHHVPHHYHHFAQPQPQQNHQPQNTQIVYVVPWSQQQHQMALQHQQQHQLQQQLYHQQQLQLQQQHDRQLQLQHQQQVQLLQHQQQVLQQQQHEQRQQWVERFHRAQQPTYYVHGHNQVNHRPPERVAHDPAYTSQVVSGQLAQNATFPNEPAPLLQLTVADVERNTGGLPNRNGVENVAPVDVERRSNSTEIREVAELQTFMSEYLGGSSALTILDDSCRTAALCVEHLEL